MAAGGPVSAPLARASRNHATWSTFAASRLAAGERARRSRSSARGSALPAPGWPAARPPASCVVLALGEQRSEERGSGSRLALCWPDEGCGQVN